MTLEPYRMVFLSLNCTLNNKCFRPLLVSRLDCVLPIFLELPRRKEEVLLGARWGPPFVPSDIDEIGSVRGR